MTFKLIPVVATALALAGSALGQFSITGLDEETVALPGSSSRYVVEFSDSGSAQFRKRDGTPDTEGFFEKVNLTNNTAVPALNFTSEIFHGASFDLINGTAQSLTEIEDLPEVQRVWPVGFVYAPIPNVEDVGVSVDDAKWDPHVLTKVNDAHKLGFDGSDVIIAVIDSGIDYTHPALGGGFGEGFKVEGGYDFVGDTYKSTAPDVYTPDSDPKDCLGHGTHVAGIIASGNKDLPGVAPKARLRAYKVFGCGDGTTEDVLAKAFIKAFEDGADIITASLGSNLGFAEHLVAGIIGRITAQGVFVSVAAGNSGEMGPYYSSSLGNGYGGLAVGSVQHNQQPVYEITAKSSGGETRKIRYVDSGGLAWNKNGTFSAYMPPVNRTSYDLCRDPAPPVPQGGLSKSDVMVIGRGNTVACQVSWTNMDRKLINVTSWAFIYNYPGALYERPDRTVRAGQPQGFASISYEDGMWLENQDDAGNKIDFEFVYDPAAAIGIDKGSVAMNTFSSWGSTLDARMKPEISAPGGGIISTYPVDKGSWALMSGTSMATPYIAGVAALFFQSVGGRAKLCSNAAEAAHRRIVASGMPVLHYDEWRPSLASVGQQGAGLVNALNVVTAKSSVSPANIHLNDTMFFQGSHTVTIRNTGDKEATYLLSHEAGTTAMSRGAGTAWVSIRPDVETTVGLAGVVLSTASIAVAAKGSASFDVAFTEPSDPGDEILAMYGGYINVVGDNDDVLRVTYMGIKGSLYDANTWETDRGVPTYLGPGGTSDIIIDDGRNFTLPALPSPSFNLLWSTRQFSFDLVTPEWQPSDWVYPPTPGKNNFIGSTTYYDSTQRVYLPFPQTFTPRQAGSFRMTLGANLTHGEPIGPGEYKILGRALRTYGEYGNIEDWQVMVSPAFVAYKA